jgi:hypothetical protein
MKPFTTAASVVFGLVCLGHITRLCLGWDVMVNGLHIPLWLSLVGMLVTGVLAFMLWWEARSK